MMIKKILLIFLMISTYLSLLGQVTNEGTPASWDMIEEKSTIQSIKLPKLDIKQIQIEDDVNDQLRTKPYRIGLQIKVDYGLNNSGTWTEFQNGDRIWRIGFSSDDALNLGLILDKFYLPEGCTLYLYNDDRSDLLGAYTNNQNNREEVLTTWFVTGDKLWVEYYEPSEVRGQSKLHISSVMHGYRSGHTYQKGYFEEGKADEFLNNSGNCNHDVNCPIGADFEAQRDVIKKGVGFLLMPLGGTSVGLCTGTLINNTNEDNTPYFLTANHCLGSGNPATYAIRFNWFSPNPICGQTTNSPTTSEDLTLSGTTLRARSTASDFMLVELNNHIPDTWDVAFVGWDRTDDIPNFTVSVHHPQGDIMKISRDDDPPSKIAQNAGGSSPVAQTWDINGLTPSGNSGNSTGWELGVTEGGSSGGALFNPEGKIIGQLYGGLAACNGTLDNNAHDYYGRFSVSWDAGSSASTRLRDWLDPAGTNPMTLDTKMNVLSVNDEFLEQNITIFPNPTSGLVQVKASGLVGDLSYEIFNLLGQSLKSGVLQNEAIQLNSLNDNIYFIKITEVDSNKILVKKVVLSK